MTNEATPTPLLTCLQEALVAGRELAAQATLTVGKSQMWALRIRNRLIRLYGENAPEVDFWCPKVNRDSPTVTPQQQISTRLTHLERLTAALVVPPGDAKIFIGHGRSPEWLKLHMFLSQTLGLACDEFNIEPTAGLHTANRIESMLTSASMAFLVMTAEDRHTDGSMHARENVVHEIGLFQARLGAARAIVMLETGCSRFSNLDGLTTINFPTGDVLARSEDIRGALAREHVL